MRDTFTSLLLVLLSIASTALANTDAAPTAPMVHVVEAPVGWSVIFAAFFAALVAAIPGMIAAWNGAKANKAVEAKVDRSEGKIDQVYTRVDGRLTAALDQIAELKSIIAGTRPRDVALATEAKIAVQDAAASSARPGGATAPAKPLSVSSLKVNPGETIGVIISPPDKKQG